MQRSLRRQIDAPAAALVARHGAQIMATARRYAATPQDAEDAYQRGLEILLTKAPSTREDELLPWLKIVVRRTICSRRRSRRGACRCLGDDFELDRVLSRWGDVFAVYLADHALELARATEDRDVQLRDI
jgi:DNA-directed RNA polymerase specialized sigma24 family protein